MPSPPVETSATPAEDAPSAGAVKRPLGPDPIEAAPLPPLQAALLDELTLDRLFQEIAALPTSLEVIVKWAPREHTPDGRTSLTEAREALRDGRAFGLQLRYPLDGSLWFDTLMRIDGGVRLVRIAHPLPSSSR